MDIKNVLVPTDFSLSSKMAVNHGVELARKFHARMTLLHVLEPHPAAKNASERERREETLQKLWSLLAPEDEDDLNLEVALKSGTVQSSIAEAIREQRADIVVLGTHGHGRLGRLIVGSTTEGLLRRLPVPVLTVCHAVRPMAFNRMLFATDLTESSAQGFAFALDMARTLQSEVVAVHAVHRAALSSGEAEPAAQTRAPAMEEARRRLSMLVTEGRRHGVEVQTLLAEGPAAAEILKAADESTADLILLSIKGKGLVERARAGVTAEHVVREANVPVLSIPVHVAASSTTDRDR